MAQFFLSYASADSDRYLEAFLDDLIGAIRDLLGFRTAEGICFRDRVDIELGEEWESKIGEALRTSLSLVPLVSPTYLKSEVCGKEWAAFAARLQEERRAGGVPPLIQPILWVPVSEQELPEAVRALQYKHAELGRIYAKKGLKHLLRLNKETEYQRFLTAFAEGLVGAIRGHTLKPGSSLALREIEPAFPVRSAPATGAAPPASGPGDVEFVVVSAPRADVAKFRTGLEPYGDLPTDWRPYAPAAPSRICPFVQHVASGEDLTSTIVPLATELSDRARQAKERKTIMVLLVDAWALRVPGYLELMREIDRLQLFNCAVLLPWNAQDPETTADTSRLQDLVRFAFESRAVMPDASTFLDGLPDLEGVRSALVSALVEIRRRIMESIRLTAAAERSLMPRVRGPGGA